MLLSLRDDVMSYVDGPDNSDQDDGVDDDHVDGLDNDVH